jgi:hypothetical protein
VSLISTAVAIVVRDIDIVGATLAPFRSLVAGGSYLRRLAPIAVVLIIDSRSGDCLAVRDGANVHFLSLLSLSFL